MYFNNVFRMMHGLYFWISGGFSNFPVPWKNIIICCSPVLNQHPRRKGQCSPFQSVVNLWKSKLLFSAFSIPKITFAMNTVLFFERCKLQ